MTRMTGGQAIIRSLKQYGVDTIFGLPGLQLDHFFNALYDDGNSIRAIHPRHEQGAAYMAYGYAMSSGKVGTFAVVPGPGLLNTTAALATAYGCYTRFSPSPASSPPTPLARDTACSTRSPINWRSSPA